MRRALLLLALLIPPAALGADFVNDNVQIPSKAQFQGCPSSDISRCWRATDANAHRDALSSIRTFIANGHKSWSSTGNGTTKRFSLPDMGSRNASDYFVTMNGAVQVPTTAYTIDWANKEIVFVSAPANGAAIEIRGLGVQTAGPSDALLQAKAYTDDAVTGALAGTGAVPMQWSFTGDGSDKGFPIPGAAHASAGMYVVALSGVLQNPGTDYTIDLVTQEVVFTVAPALGVPGTVRSFGYARQVNVSDLSGVVAQGSTTSRSLSARFGETFNVRDFGADNTGAVDVRSAFQAAADAACASSASTREIVIPPGTYRMQASTPTVLAPYRGMRIPCSNVSVRGVGRPTVNMVGVSKAYIDSIDDYVSSGRDVFTAFSFVQASNCRIEGVRVIGEWDGTGTFRYQSPRAKAIGLIGTTNCTVDDVEGKDLLGNVVNATPCFGATYDCASGAVAGVRVTNSVADRVLENGFNAMGNTSGVTFANNAASGCGSAGIEAASAGLVVTGNRVSGNKVAGLAISGSDAVVSGNVITANGSATDGTIGNGISLSGSAITHDITIGGNTISGNRGFGVQVYPAVSRVTIVGNTFKDNGQGGPPNTAGVNAVGSLGNLISSLTVSGNEFIDTGAGAVTSTAVNASYTTGLRVLGNTISLQASATAAVVTQTTSTGSVVTGNSANKAYSIGTGSGFHTANERDGYTYFTFKSYGGTQAFSEWTGNSATGTAPAVTTWKTGNTLQGFMKITVNGVQRWIPIYDDPTGP